MPRLADISFSILPFFLQRIALRLFCRVKVTGLEHLAAAGPRALIVSNHVSCFDAVILSAFLPGRMLFAVPPNIASSRWLRPYGRAGYALDQTNAITAKTMIEALKAGRRCLIFPEGHVGRTGGLMKVYASPGMIADKADAAIVPVRLDGPQYSRLSELRGFKRQRFFPRLTITVMAPRKLTLPEGMKGHKRRQIAGARLYDLMEEVLVTGAPVSTMLRQFLKSRAIRGGGGIAVEDVERRPLTHNAFAGRFFALARRLSRLVGKDEKTVGIMLANGIPNAEAIFAVEALDRAAAMMNFTAGPVRVAQSAAMAEIRSVVTARAFVAALHLEPVVEALEEAGVKLLYLEDCVPGAGDRLAGFFRARLPAALAACGTSRDADGPALMLFTSGTEGLPKGVMLSHRNVIGNGIQFGVRVGFSAGDSVFACLPMFHSFGLTLGFFMPLFYGTRTFLYPTPLRYHDIPELVYDTGATLLLGTDTFLSNYARNAAPHDFYFLRFAIGGAERIKPETKRLWAEKFGVRLCEGYGTTEASPVISTNAPLYYKADTVGRAVSGMELKVRPIEGIETGGELWVRGLNLMLGYVGPEAPGKIRPIEGGWYDTGDVVSLDEEGFITILGRTKRFAKIGGEMVSLAAIETAVSGLWPEMRHVAVGIPDGRKGEAVVLLTESEKADLDTLTPAFRAAGLTELSLPKKIVKVDRVPLLGSGKTDYAAAKALALAAETDE